MTKSIRAALVATPIIIGSLVLPASTARAGIVVSQMIVELVPGRHTREDMEVWNDSDNRAYIAIEPSEIENAGQPTETRVREADPAKLGLLVSPTRMILEPGQRKIVRVALISPQANRERIYRVTIKPVAGELSSAQSGLKILVGYDALVIARPIQVAPNVIANRSGDDLSFRNAGNVSVELVGGQQCDVKTKNCVELPGKRLYAGAVWHARLKSPSPADYTIQMADQSIRKRFDAANNVAVAWNPSSSSRGER